MTQPPPLDSSFASTNSMPGGQSHGGTATAVRGPSSAVGLTAGFAAGASSIGAGIPAQQQNMPAHPQYRPVLQPTENQKQQQQQQQQQPQIQPQAQQQQPANLGTGQIMGSTGGSGADSGVADEFDFPDGLREQASVAVKGFESENGGNPLPCNHLPQTIIFKVNTRQVTCTRADQ